MATVPRAPLISTPPKRSPCAEPGPVSNLLLTTLLSKDKFFTVAGDGPSYDWPTPPERPRQIDLRTWTNPVNLNLRSKDLFFTVAGKAPTYDYPNPVGWHHEIQHKTFAQSVNLNLLSKDKFFTAAGKAPTYDYPNPVPWRHDVSHKTWIQTVNQNLLSKDKFFAAAGEAPRYDWPTPSERRQPPSTWILPSNIALFTTPVIVNPFKATDWPVPAGRLLTRDLLTSILSLNLNLTDHGYPANIEWPSPIPGIPRSDLLTWLFSFNPDVLAPPVLTRPFQNVEWSVPRSQSSTPDARFFTALNLNLQSHGKPFNQADWPTPPNRTDRAELRNWLDSLKLNLQAQDKFFTVAGDGPQYDWPNPTPRQAAALSWILSTNLSLLTAPIIVVPFNQTDWPTPFNRADRAELRTWIDALKLNLQGKDKFFGAAGEPPRYDYPLTISRPTAEQLRTWLYSLPPSVLVPKPFFNPDWTTPQGRKAAIELQTWLESLNLNLLGKDRFFGAAGQPPNNLEWNLVKERLRAIEWILSSFPPNIPNVTGHLDQIDTGSENRKLRVPRENRRLRIPRPSRG